MLSLFILSRSIFAQSLPSGADQPVATGASKLDVEDQWRQLQIAKTPWNSPAGTDNRSEAEKKVARDQEAAAYLAAADKFKAFYSDNPASAHAREAKRLEAMTLMYAATIGNNANEGRWQNLVAEVRRDKALPAADRFAAAALADSLVVRQRKFKTKAEHLAAHETVAKGLIAEFPTERGGYESILGVARNADAAKSAELCDFLQKVPAPTDIKYTAAQLGKRYALAGQSVQLLVRNSGVKLEWSEKAPLVIYGWATWSPGSQALAKALREQAGSATLVGLCLDTDLESARLAGKDLPGQQVYDARGTEGALAQALRLQDAGWVYLVDRTGRIRTVRAQDDLRQIAAEK